MFVKPKDSDHKFNKSEVIYRVRCSGCSENYIGESGRVFRDRFRDHLREPSPVHFHRQATGHPPPTESDVDILATESNCSKRLYKESMFIRVNNPALNRNIGKYQLPHIYDSVLKDCNDLMLK